MQALSAIARLTVKAAFRFRLVPLLLAALVGAVLLLPAVIKDDGTARGLTQIVLTYTLGLTTALLGLATLWLACGTLARDVEECQMQVVAVKPVARWQIWLGKWLGILLLDALVLGVVAAIVYVEIHWRARHLSPAQQETLRREIFVARGSLKEPLPDIEADVQRVMRDRLKKPELAAMNREELEKFIRAQINAQLQVVPPGMMRVWRIPFGIHAAAAQGQPLYLRAKFYVSQKSNSGTYLGLWEAGPPESPGRWRDAKSQAAETFYEFPLVDPRTGQPPANLLDPHGVLTIDFANQNDTAVLFPLDEGLEVLYREGGFGLNYVRGVAILFCWLALLAAVGLAAASFLSFPVAAFFSLGVLLLGFSTSTMNQVIEQGTIREVNHNTGVVDQPNFFDHASVLIFRSLLWLVGLARGFSPIESLSSGRSVTWSELALAVGQIVLVLGGLFALVGILAFSRRELATAQSKT